MSRVGTYRQKIHELLNEMLSVVMTLPEPVMRFRPSDNKWSILQVLAHIEEANAFWVNELTETLANPSRAWGRTLQHESRLGAVAAAHNRRVEDVMEGVRATGELIDRTLAGLTDEALEVRAEHVNPKFGNQPMSFLIEHFLIEHIAGHIDQIRRNLSSYDKIHKEET